MLPIFVEKIEISDCLNVGREKDGRKIYPANT
jgi:hypothetical protein